MSKNSIILTTLFLATFILSGCNFKNVSEKETPKVAQTSSPTSEISSVVLSPIEQFLIKLTKETKLPFGPPIKADIVWTEGETVDTRKTFFGDSYLIEYLSPVEEDEKTVEKYFKDNDFVYMKFNESKGEESHKVGYRKENLVCKYDWSRYPEETQPHLNICCSDANLGAERK